MLGPAQAISVEKMKIYQKTRIIKGVSIYGIYNG